VVNPKNGRQRALTAVPAVRDLPLQTLAVLHSRRVDAPLDEVNNERFVRLVRDMSRDTQFIVITHSRRTPSYAKTSSAITTSR
jgi:chromosome segregation protein